MTLRRCTSSALACWIACAGAVTAQAPPPAPERVEGTATIRYDPGTDLYSAGSLKPVVGNLFDTQFGQPLASGTIYRISAVIGSDGGYDGSFAVAGPVAGTTAPFLAAPRFPADTAYTAVASFSPLDVPSVFVVGFLVNLAQGLGLATRTTQGQGFHAHSWYGGYGNQRATGIRPIAGQNATIRVTGSVAVVPVELLEFDLD